jgi:aspartate racemase
MSQVKFKTIGIIGGVGPIATAHFFTELLSCVDANCDQDFPRVVIDSDASIPDRTKALLGEGEDPTSALVRAAKHIESIGAEVICLPCNTAHAFFGEVKESVNVPVINMVEAVVEHIESYYPSVKKIGLLATTGTRIANVYDKTINEKGMEVIHVSEEVQVEVMDAIYGPLGIKAGHVHQPRKILRKAADELMKKGAEVIILGCTELPVALTSHEIPLISSTRVLAHKTIEQASSKTTTVCHMKSAQ